jgi:hypothetical protein
MRSSLIGGIACAAILSIGLVLTACGSSNDNSTSTTAALTKAAFLKQGNAVCRKGNQQIQVASNKAFPKGKKPTAAAEKEFINGTLIPDIQKEIDGVSALGAPKGDEAKVKAIVDSAQSDLDQAKKDPTVFFSNKGDPFKKSNKLANAYGLTVCGGG